MRGKDGNSASALGTTVCIWTAAKMIIRTPELSKTVGRDMGIERASLGLCERMAVSKLFWNNI